jgi:Fic family protein
LDFFLEGVTQTAGAAVQTAHRLLTLFQQDDQEIQSLGRSAPNALRIAGTLRKRPITTINELVRLTGISYPTVVKLMAALAELGIIHELTGQQRNRLFVYNNYLTILNEGTEPL